MADHLGQLPGGNLKFSFSFKGKMQLGEEKKRRVPRGRHSAVRAGKLGLCDFTRSQTLSPTGERVALIRMMDA
jgi:hypothetical protein